MRIINRNDIKNFILKIENDYPVDKWKIDDIDIWPIIRIKLYFLLISATESSFKKKEAITNDKVENHSIVHRIRTHRKTKRLKAWFKLIQLNKVDFLFGTAYSHRANYNNKSYNKFADPLMDEKKNNSIVIEHSPSNLYNLDNLYKKKRISFLYDFLDFTIYSEKRKERLTQKMNFTLPEYENFLSLLNSEKTISSKIQQFKIEALKTLICRFHDFEETYIEIIKRTRPKVVFTVCYYNFTATVLNYVANKNNIKTIEIQHGPQSDIHMAYSLWSKIPDPGYNTLPKTFWNWDEYSHQIIKKWANKPLQHNSFIGGNPWIDFFKQNQQKERKRILYSLQPLHFDLLFPDYLIEIIKNTPNSEWWFRLHPGQLDSLNEIESFLALKKIKHLVNINEATKIPLPEILSQTKIHITNFSGCTLEAVQYNIPTIIINRLGADTFQEIINEKKAFYISEKNELNEKLNTLINSSQQMYHSKKSANYKQVIGKLL